MGGGGGYNKNIINVKLFVHLVYYTAIHVSGNIFMMWYLGI